MKRTIIEAIQLGCSGRSRFAIISEENVKLVQHAQLILGQDEDAGGARSEHVGQLVLEGQLPHNSLTSLIRSVDFTSPCSAEYDAFTKICRSYYTSGEILTFSRDRQWY